MCSRQYIGTFRQFSVHHFRYFKRYRVFRSVGHTLNTRKTKKSGCSYKSSFVAMYCLCQCILLCCSELIKHIKKRQAEAKEAGEQEDDNPAAADGDDDDKDSDSDAEPSND